MAHHLDGDRLKGEEWDKWYNEPRPTEREVLDFLKNAWGKPLAVDTETTGLEVRDGRDFATGVTVAYRGSGGVVGHYFPFRHFGPGNYGDTERAYLKRLIESAPLIVFHNAKFDLASLLTLGIDFQGMWYDTAVMAYLINEYRPFTKKLDALVKFYVDPNRGKVKSPELDAFIDAYGWAWVPAAMMRRYATFDGTLTFEVIDKLWPLWDAEGLDDFWRKQKQPLINVVRKMEERGIKVDVEYCEKMRDMAAEAMADYRHHLGALNPTSPKSQEHFLVDVLGIPPYMKVKKTKKRLPDGSYETLEKTAISFDAEAYRVHWGPYLERLNEPLAEYVLGYRGWQKADSAFYKSYLAHLSPDGRLRPRYAHHKDEEEGGTVTGRLSCSEPNLQQIPKTSEKLLQEKPWNAGVKRSFIPAPGYELWEVDYSQLELRLGTAYAKEAGLIAVFDEGRDIFDEMAERIGLDRQRTKSFVYSTQYGAGIERLVSALGVTPAHAAKIREDYYRAYPGFRRVAEWASGMARRNKFVPLWSGRRRHFVNPRAEAHKAMNAMIQGGAADIVERQMIRVYNDIDVPSGGEVKMLLQVHDSIIFEIKSGTTDLWLPKIKNLMEDVNALTDNGFGVKWAVDAHPLHDNYKGNYGRAA